MHIASEFVFYARNLFEVRICAFNLRIFLKPEFVHLIAEFNIINML